MIKHLLLGLAVLGLTGCSLIEAKNNVENAKRLRMGMTKAEVLAIMGEPLIDEQFNTPDHWYYFVHSEWMDGINAEEECMPLVFEKGKLVGWGKKFYGKYLYTRERRVVSPEETLKAKPQASETLESESQAPESQATKTSKAD